VPTETAADTPPRPEFLALGALYKQEIEPWLKAQEGRRRRARRLRWVIIGSGAALLAAWLYYILANEWSDFWLFVTFILGIGVLLVGNIPLWSLESDVKAFVMETLAGFFKFSYEAKPEFADFGLFQDLFLLPHHHNKSFEDGLQGEVKGVPFCMVEAHLTERRKSGKNTRNVTVFRGLLLSLPHDTGEDAVSVWRRDAGQWTEGEGWGEVALGDTAFDRDYIVHSDDAATARRLLDRETRRAFAALDGREDVEEVRLGLIDGRLLFAISLGINSFEAGKMNRPLADPNRVQSMVELFAIPFDAVESFKPQPSADAPQVQAG
jgi:hypothetical protein